MARATKTKKKSRSTSKKRSPKPRRTLLPAFYFLIIISALIGTLYLYSELDNSILRPHNVPAKPSNKPPKQLKNKPAPRQNRLKEQQPPAIRPALPTTLRFYRLEQNFSQAIRLKKTFDRTLTREQKADEIIRLLTLSHKPDLAPLPQHTKLLASSFTAPLITIDLSQDLSKGAVNFGGRDEMLAISCLTNSFLENFPAFTSLQILVEGQKRETLAGHIDISQPLRYQPSTIEGVLKN